MLQTGRPLVRIPDEVNFFNVSNPYRRTMALGSTQPLTEMSTRNLPGGKKRPARRTHNLAAIYETMSENVGASTSRSPKGLHGLCRGNFTFFYLTIQRCSARASATGTKGTVNNQYRGGLNSFLSGTIIYSPYCKFTYPRNASILSMIRSSICLTKTRFEAQIVTGNTWTFDWFSNYVPYYANFSNCESTVNKSRNSLHANFTIALHYIDSGA
jgi:hypothetical protein